MDKNAVCGSCHSPAKSFGTARKNDKGQYLVSIRPHMKSDGMPCYAKIGVVPSK